MVEYLDLLFFEKAPLPKAGLMAPVGAAVLKAQFEFALGLLIGWSAYLMPLSSLVPTTGASLTPPAPSVNLHVFGLLLFPSKRERLGKTLINDKSVMLGIPEMRAMSRASLRLMRDSNDSKPLWTSTPATLHVKFKEALALAGLLVHIGPYQTRHCAASLDALSMARTLREIQERLRHSTDVATMRYRSASGDPAELYR